MNAGVVLRVALVLVTALVAVVLPQWAAAGTGTCSGNVAGNATLTCQLDVGHAAQKLTVLAEQACAGAGSMTIQLYPKYANGDAQIRTQFLATEMSQNQACNATATIAQRRWVGGGLQHFTLTVQNADATNARDLRAEWFTENAPLDTVIVDHVAAPVNVAELAGAPPLDVSCSSGCAGAPAGGMELSEADRDALTLGWWGTWTVAGLLLVLISVPSWEKAWRFWRE